MKSLFLKSLSRLTSQLNPQMPSSPTLQQVSNILTQKYAKPLKSKDLHRLPTSSLRTVLKIPCPSSQIQKQQIQIFKRLRLTYSIEQNKVCEKCPRFQQCPFKNLLPEEKYQSKLQHLLFFMMEVAKRGENEYSQLRWDAAYRLCESLGVFVRGLADMDAVRTQSKIYNQVQHWQQQLDKKSKQSNQPNKKNINQLYKNRKFKISPTPKPTSNK